MLRGWPILALAAALTTCGITSAQKDLYDTTVLRTLDLRFAQTDWYAQILKNKSSETYIKADLRIDGTLYRDVGIRGRGGTVWAGTLKRGTKKLPFKISTNEFVPGQDVQGYDKLVLSNGWWDPTFLREVLTLKMMREFVPAPKANFVKLVINGENWGVYINVQPVDAEFVEANYEDASGNRYKGEQDLKYYGPDPAKWRWPIQLRTPNSPTAYRDVIRAMATTTLLPLSKREQEVPKVIDIDGAHRQLAIHVATGNSDSTPRHNYYLYLDPRHDQMRVIPWDMNQAFWDRDGGVHFVPRIFGDTDLWQRRYRGHLRNAIDRFLDWRVVGPWLTTWQKLIDAEVKADTKKLYSYADFQNNLATSSVRIDPNISILSIKAGVEKRRAWILSRNNLLSGPRVLLSAPSHTPRAPKHTQAVQFTVRATCTAAIHRVLLHYRTRGAFAEVPMFDDGLHGDGRAGDGIYGVQIAAQRAGTLVSYYFSATADLQKGGDVNFLPYNTARSAFRFRVAPKQDSVLIHEFLARNSTGIRDPTGARDDWIELYNPTSTAVDLSGRYLTDDPTKPTKWQFAAGTTIAPAGTLLIWADDEPTQGANHATFRLSGDGEELALFDRDGETALDFVAFGPQKKDVSIGRLFDRPGPWVSYTPPSPNRGHELRTCGARTWSALDPDALTLHLAASGTFRINTTMQFLLGAAPAQAPWMLRISGKPANFAVPVLGLFQMIDGPVLVEVLLRTDALGQSSVTVQIPNDAKLVGLQLALQGLSHDGTRFLGSNGLEIRLCK